MIRSLIASSALGMIFGAATALPAAANTLRQTAVSCGAERSIETPPGETAELVFADGTSVILAPGAAAKTSCSSTGQISITLTRGLMRVAGGVTGGTVRITTPNADLSLVAGSAIVEVAGGATRTHLLAGQGLRVSSGRAERLIFRPGFQVIASAGSLSAPRRVDRDTLIADILALSEGLQTGVGPRVISQRSGSAPGGTLGTSAGTSTATAAGNIAPPQVDELEPTVTTGGGGGGNGGGGGGSIVVALGNLGSLGGLGGLTPTTGGAAPPVQETSTTTVDTNYSFIRQKYDDEPDGDRNNGSGEDFLAEVSLGPTTNRLFNTADLSPTITAPSDLGAIITTNGGQTGSVGYYYGSRTAGLVSSVAGSFSSDTGVVRLNTLPIGLVDAQSLHAISAVDSFIGIPIRRADTTFGVSGSTNAANSFAGTGFWNEGSGVLVRGLNYGTLYTRANVDEFSLPPLVTDVARTDNFMFLDMSIVAALNWISDSCLQGACQSAFDAAVAAKVSEYAIAGAAAGSPGSSTIYATTFEEVGAFGGATGAALVENPLETRRYIFAAGGLDQVLDNPTARPAGATGPVVDRFHLSAGMEGPVRSGIGGLANGMFTGAGNRAFLRAETWTDLAGGLPGFNLQTTDLTQSGLAIVYPDAPVIGAGAATPKVFYADFGLKQDSSGRQVSTISATIGQVQFRLSNELANPYGLDNAQSVDAILQLRTIGSSRGLSAGGATAASVLAFGGFESTAAGGGNTNLGTGGVADPGRLGFFVLENAGTVFDDVAARAPLTGGIEAPLGTAPDQRFALLRLGVATGSAPVATGQLGFGAGMTGYAAAITETENGTANVTLGLLGAPDLQNRQTVSAVAAPNLGFSGVNAVDNSFTATLAGLSLGGTAGQSAFVDDATYGARSTGAGSELALISGESVVAGTTAMAGGSATRALQTTTQNYQFVQWGFFFGDTKSTGAREHAHLGSYAAIAALPDSLTNLTTATVTYDGHVVANVSSGGQIYSASGSYQDQFDFGSRRGSITMDFDNRVLTGGSATLDVGQPYAGSLPYTGEVTGGGLIGELNGQFGGQQTLAGGAWAPAGVVGAFSLTGIPGSGPADYTAVGTFAGE